MAPGGRPVPAVEPPQPPDEDEDEGHEDGSPAVDESTEQPS